MLTFCFSLILLTVYVLDAPPLRWFPPHPSPYRPGGGPPTRRSVACWCSSFGSFGAPANLHANKHHHHTSTGTSCRLHPQPTQYYILNMWLIHTPHNDIACLYMSARVHIGYILVICTAHIQCPGTLISGCFGRQVLPRYQARGSQGGTKKLIFFWVRKVPKMT